VFDPLHASIAQVNDAMRAGGQLKVVSYHDDG
jgi:hypothetical protein